MNTASSKPLDPRHALAQFVHLAAERLDILPQPSKQTDHQGAEGDETGKVRIHTVTLAPLFGDVDKFLQFQVESIFLHRASSTLRQADGRSARVSSGFRLRGSGGGG